MRLAVPFRPVLRSPHTNAGERFPDVIGFGSGAAYWSGGLARIYVGNLPFATSEQELRELFEQHGAVRSVRLVNDPQTGRPRGFGFVDMDDGDARAAVEALHGKYFGGRILRVEEAKGV